jgi:sterol desaturase/sphingolipid hydroxylase (fatty acid hydroxylase superfamily)
MHTPYAWENWHRMHHIAPQSAISATYVHPVEYAIFSFSMQLPFACLGIPYYVYIFPMGWGMMTGSGAHSGYTGDFANGDKHNAHVSVARFIRNSGYQSQFLATLCSTCTTT